MELGSGALHVSNFKVQVSSPLRWDIDTPHLYTAVVKTITNGNITDEATRPFGIRDIEWKPGSGMWLNGRIVKLHGVCNHQHAGAFGAAVPKKIIRYRVEQLKAMGCNAIRCAHNPHTPEFYEICDEVGMLVMDEFTDGWHGKATHDYGRHSFNEWWQRDLTDWIRRDRNHPRVFIWSIGNETDGEVGKELLARCHELDPSRPVTSGSSAEADMDVYGENGMSEYVDWFDKLPQDRVFIGTENTHTWQVRGYYRTQTWYRDGKIQVVQDIPDLTEKEIFTYDWTDNSHRKIRKQFYHSSYDNATVRSTSRHMIEQIRDIPNNAGMFRWTGHDYLGEAGLASGAWPFRSFTGGAIDLANFEKDLYYLYQSQWTEEPMVHILPHWTHPVMKLGTEIPVWVYSNCEEVELFHNGNSLGIIKPGEKWNEMQCQWMVGWEPGEIKAVGYNAGKTVVEETIRTADEPAKLVLSIDGPPLNATGSDIVQVRVAMQDAKSEFYPYGENRVWFNLNGPARFKALDNGSPNDVEPFFGVTDRAAFFGLTRAYVESDKTEGDIVLLAGAILGEKKLVLSNKVHIDVQQIALRGGSTLGNIKIFYTTNGSTPTQRSTRYFGAFKIELGTTVKARVMQNGKLALMMEERFAEDVGLVWENAGTPDDFGSGEQAEDATFEGATVSKAGGNFKGSGFLDMGKETGSYVEWYRENDGGVARKDLYIRYSCNPEHANGVCILLNVNGESLERKLRMPKTGEAGVQWRIFKTGIQLKKGATRIRITTIEEVDVYIDEISL